MPDWAAFWRGVGSIFVVLPEPLNYSLSDDKALAHDWETVASDLRTALENLPNDATPPTSKP